MGVLIVVNNLKKIRLEKGLTQSELSRISNVYPDVISKIENNRLRPYPKWKRALSEALDLPEGELFPPEQGWCQ